MTMDYGICSAADPQTSSLNTGAAVAAGEKLAGPLVVFDGRICKGTEGDIGIRRAPTNQSTVLLGVGRSYPES